MRAGALLGGRFLLELRAGAGGMGEVWRARDRDSGQPVAVKLLPGQGAEDAARFTREARILSALEHPGIVRYLSHGETDEGAPYLVMEWLDGEDLAARLARGRLGIDESVALARDVADAVAFAHARGVVHRDLKPSNLFLPGGRIEAVRLLDFGIAYAGFITRVTRTGLFMGTPGYMAPEQARGELDIDTRADVFSLGCVLFECLTGQPPFRGAHPAAILTKVLFEDAPAARALRPELPAALDALLARMLSKRREDRPSDGRAAAALLHALGDLSAAPHATESPASVRGPGLTAGEQRATALILVSAPPRAGEAPQDGAPTIPLDTDAALLREAARHGGAGERLLDGSVAVLMAGGALATDRCAQAARCALALRRYAEGRSIALTMGRGDRGSRFMGSAIDRAARLSAAGAPAGAVALDEVVAGLLDARFDVREEGGTLALYDERPLADSVRFLMGKVTPCVGRERELATLRQLFAESAEERKAQAVLAVGPSGIGKSRLARELLRELRASAGAISIWVARGDALRAASPFGLLGQALRGACGVSGGEPLEARREELLAHHAAIVGPGEQRGGARFLGEIMGVPFPDGDDLPLRAARGDARLMADQVRAAFLDLLGAACLRSPVILLLEDLQWGDRASVQLIDVALRALADLPLFVLALARPEVWEAFPRLWHDRRLHEVRLNELSRRACERLARHVLGPDTGADEIARVVRLSEGNAFYLEELLRWTADGRGADVPVTVVAMVESRLGSLDEDDRRLLRAASVFGEVFWIGGVAALLGQAGSAATTERLAALERREILVRRRESRFPGEEELAFRHALLREGAYAMLTDEDRRLGHRLAGEWLEARGEQDAQVLARHFEHGGDGPAAGRHYLRAAHMAGWAGDAVGSIVIVRRALTLPLPDELRASLLGALCEACIWQVDQIAAVQREAEMLWRAAPRGTVPWAQSALALLISASLAGRPDELFAVVAELSQAEAAPDAGHPMALALGTAALTLDALGRTREAGALLSKLEDMAGSSPDRDVTVACQSLAVMALRAGAGDDPFGTLERAREYLTLARRIGSPRYESFARLSVALNVWCLGAGQEAEETLREVRLSDAELGPAWAYRRFILAWLLADRGALDEARAHAEELAAASGARGLPHDVGRARWILAEVLRRGGELSGAEREALVAVEALQQVCPLDAPGALATLAAIRLAQGDAAAALSTADEGMALYAEMGRCSHFYRDSFLRLVQVESLHAAGRQDDARAALAAARDRIHSIALKIPDPAYRQSFLESVPENRRTLALAEERLE